MADRYWVGGSATWDATAGTKWATTSGGTGGAAVPTSADDVYFDANSGISNVTISAGVCRNLSFTSPAGNFGGTIGGTSTIAISGSMTLSPTMTWGFYGTITFNATSAQTITSAGVTILTSVVFNGVGGSWKLLDNFSISNAVSATTTLTNGTFDLNNFTHTTNRFLSDNSNTRSIAFGTGKIVLNAGSTLILAMATATGFSVTGSRKIQSTYSGGTGNREFRFGSTAGATEANALDIDILAGTDGVYLGTLGAGYFRNIDLTGFAGTLRSIPLTVYGSYKLSTGLTMEAGTYVVTFASTAAGNTITSNGKTFDNPVTFNGVGGSWKFIDAFSVGSTRTLTLTNGTIDADGKNVSLGSFALGSGTKTLTLGSGTWTVLGSGANAWNANTNVANLTVSASSGTITLTSASAKTFQGGAKTWPTLNQGGSGALTIQQSNTFANITNTVQPATITLTAGTTQTVSAFSVSGTSGNLITLNSSSAGSAATISRASGLTNISNTSVKDITATGQAFYAYLFNGNTNGGNNVGIRFNLPDASFLPCVAI